MIKTKCQQCGKVFETYACWMKRNRGKYCSKKCKYKATPYPMNAIAKMKELRSKGLFIPKKRGGSEERKCIGCGKLFPIYKSEIKKGSNKQYCSNDCLKSTKKKCIICERKFYPNHANQKYCGTQKDINTCAGKVGLLQSKLVAIKQRCLNHVHQVYKYYHLVGICDEWLMDSFSFVSWALNNGWVDGLQIDRQNNDKGYSPENCRFVTASENMRNKKNVATDWKKKIRRCRVCKIRKPFKDFNVSRNEVGGISYECIMCRKEIDRKKHINTYKPKRRNNGWNVKGRYFRTQQEASIYFSVSICTISCWQKTGNTKLAKRD